MKKIIATIALMLMSNICFAGVTNSPGILSSAVISSNQHHDVIACRNSITLSVFGCYVSSDVVPIKEFIKRAGYNTLHSVSVVPINQSATEVLLILEVSNEEDTK